MIPVLETAGIPTVTDLTGYATQLLEAAAVIAFIYLWVVYRRFPTKGRFIGPTEWTLFGQGTKFGGNTVYITDWAKNEFFEHVKGLGVDIPEGLRKLLASDKPEERIYLYGIRSEAAVDRFDRDFGKILILSTENIEDPKFHDNLVARRILWMVTKMRVMCDMKSIELGEDVVKGWTTFVALPRPVNNPESSQSSPSQAFSSIPWEKVATIVGVLSAAAHKASKEGMFKTLAEAAWGKVHELETEIRKVKDELDITKKALSKKGLEGGESAVPIIPTKGNLIMWLFIGGISAIAGGLLYYKYNLPEKLDEAAQLLLSNSINNFISGAFLAVIVVAAIIKWRMKQ